MPIEIIPVSILGPFLILHGILASSYTWIQDPWGHSRFEAMFSPLLQDQTVDNNLIAHETFHFFHWFTFLLGCLRVYAGVGLIQLNDSAIHMAQLSYICESICFIDAQMRGTADPAETFLPAYATLIGLVVFQFRVRPTPQHMKTA